MLGRRSKKRVYWPFTHLDDVVGYKTVRLSMDSFHGFTVGTLGETERGSIIVIEPIRDVADSVVLLNRKIEFVGRGDLGRCHPRYVVAIKEQGHDAMLVTPGTSCWQWDGPFGVWHSAVVF
jgi:hypothetical protein